MDDVYMKFTGFLHPAEKEMRLRVPAIRFSYELKVRLKSSFQAT